MRRLIIALAAILCLGAPVAAATSASAATQAPRAPQHGCSWYGYVSQIDSGNAGNVWVTMSVDTCHLKWWARVRCTYLKNAGVTYWVSSSPAYGVGSRVGGCKQAYQPTEAGYDIINASGAKVWTRLWTAI